MEQALSGIKVVELAEGITGPYAGNLMAGLGAEVIKVEPLGGDCTRRVGPFPEDVPDPEKSGLFLYLNMGKKSITLNLAGRAAVDLLRALVKDADILLESSPPGYLDSVGLAYEELESANPGFVLVSITGFGQTGPYKDYLATDLITNAVSGLMATMGDPDREPMNIGGWMSHYHVGAQAFSAALIALYSREATGQGQHVDISAMEAMTAASENSLAGWPYNHELEQRSGNLGRFGAQGIFSCRDGFVNIDTVIGNFHSFEILAKLTGIHELSDPAFADADSRIQHAEEINDLIRPWVEERTKAEIYPTGQSHRLPFGYVANVQDLLESPQLRDREFFVEVDHLVAGRLVYPGAPFRMSETPWQSGRAPLLGEHNLEIYCGRLKYSRATLVRLRQQGVI